MKDDAPWQTLRRHLEDLRQDVLADIRDYPPPITGCDAQFNHLLELRGAVASEQARLEEAASEGRGSVEDFVRTSPCRAELLAVARDG